MRSESISLDIADIERRFGVVAKELARCAVHGEYASIISTRSETPSGCPRCAEIARTESDKAELDALSAKNATCRLERKLGSALIPRRFQDRTFAGYNAVTQKQIKALTTCIEYAENFKYHRAIGRCLLMLGKPGTGKTHLAAAIAAHVIQHGAATAAYRTVSSILQYIKGSYSRDSEYSEADAFDSLTAPDLLLIDEVGATKATEFEQATLFQIINARYEEQLPTVVISNLMPGELPAAIGERCVDRLREGGGIALVFDWASVRAEVGRG